MMRGLVAALAVLCGACSAGSPAPKPKLHILTALPLFWGEGDVADVLQNRTAPAPSLTALSASWDVVALDMADARALHPVQTLLLIQPPRLAPAELVALDAWVRQGGRVVILADPDLRWPQQRPIGDPRRAPVTTLLSPLYRHWGLDLQPDAMGSPPRHARIAAWTIALPGSGQWVRASGRCRLPDPALAYCQLGKGGAVLIADADFLQPEGDAAAQARAIAAINGLLTDKNQ
ncbi:MAG: hypothetical protein RLZ59_68 [Pseudomonadota bacterium]|jgi:hypothetical protein